MMSETPENTPNEPANPALDELMANVAKMNDGLSGLVASALRMQVLVLEDTQNMMAEFSAVMKATSESADKENDA